MKHTNNLKQICCERLGISIEDFEKTVLFACVPSRMRWLARLLWFWRPSYFKVEILIIQRAALCGNLQEVIQIYEAYRAAYGLKLHKIQMSENLLIAFVSKYLPLNREVRPW